MSQAPHAGTSPSRLAQFRLRLEEILTPAEEGDLASRLVDLFLVTLILTDLILVLLEDGQRISLHQRSYVIGLNVILGIFVVEYGLRLWASGVDPLYAGKRGLARFMRTPLMIIDLLSILPALGWLPFVNAAPLEQFMLLRVFRLLRLLRYFEPVMVVLVRTIMRVQREMGVIFVGMMMVVVCSSVLMQRLEPETFETTGEAMWWSVVTLTTVGYGDYIPLTIWGRIIGAVLMIVGVGMFALPAGLLGSAFTREIAVHQERRQINRERRRERRRGEAQQRKEEAEAEAVAELEQTPGSEACPHCGMSLRP